MVFALDVGTRKVAGLIADREGENVRLFYIEVLEHEKRAMIDGAVHDVERVARTVRLVKEAIETRNELKIEKAAIALAGRFLKTIVGEAEIDVSGKGEIDEEDVMQLELMAVRNAMDSVNPDEMFCVGYSVLSYDLDGAWMMNLVGHRGKVARVKVISAFLPVQVVDAMTAVMKRVGLEIEHMTLEPIAAIEVAVPEEVRLLNIALVDVGAGTSDIAISKDGVIIAYGMVPMAGDEITEAIAKEYLLDFNVAEAVKRSLVEKSEFKVRDVLDSVKVITRKDLYQVIDPVIDAITGKIAETIIELNGGSPKAIMVVGGGAKVPGFVERLAEKLSLPKERVSLKGVENVPFLQDYTKRLSGSDLVTPVGIAKSALFGKGSIFSRVYVNDVPIKMMGLGGKYTVMQVLMQAGYDLGDIIGRPAPALVYEVNGKVKSFRRGGIKVRITVNGKEATTKTLVQHGDHIKVEKSEEVVEEKLKVKDAVEKVIAVFEGEEIPVLPKFMVNGEYVDEDYEIKDGDKVEHEVFVPVKRIKEAVKEHYRVVVNGQVVFPEIEVRVVKGDEELPDSESVRVGERVDIVLKERPKLRNVLLKSENDVIRVKFNGQEIKLPLVEFEIDSNGRKLSLDDEIENGMEITVKKKRLVPMVATLLAHLPLDIGRISRYKIYKNGVEVGFSELLSDGDEIEFVEEG